MFDLLIAKKEIRWIGPILTGTARLVLSAGSAPDVVAPDDESGADIYWYEQVAEG